MKKVLVLGGVSYDTIVYLKNFFEPKPQTVFSSKMAEMVGSTGAGKSACLAKIGFSTTFHFMKGTDAYGQKIEDYLKSHGVLCISDPDPKGSERHVNIMDAEGRRISIFISYSTFEPEFNAKRLEAEIETCDYLVMNIINYTRKMIPFAKASGKEIWCDIHDYNGKNEYFRDYVNEADYLFMSSDSMENYQDFMYKMIAEGKKLVVCTHGKKGACAMGQDKKMVEQPILSKYPFVDSNGAGDSFFSGFLFGYSRGYDLVGCMRFGAIAGGLCISSSEIVHPHISEQTMLKEYQELFEN